MVGTVTSLFPSGCSQGAREALGNGSLEAPVLVALKVNQDHTLGLYWRAIVHAVGYNLYCRASGPVDLAAATKTKDVRHPVLLESGADSPTHTSTDRVPGKPYQLVFTAYLNDGDTTRESTASTIGNTAVPIAHPDATDLRPKIIAIAPTHVDLLASVEVAFHRQTSETGISNGAFAVTRHDCIENPAHSSDHLNTWFSSPNNRGEPGKSNGLRVSISSQCDTEERAVAVNNDGVTSRCQAHVLTELLPRFEVSMADETLG